MSKYLVVIWMFVLSAHMAWAQDQTISGKVSSAEDGTVLPGVSVSVKGTTLGTVTDAEGNFKLTVPQSSTLVFSFVGLKTQEIVVSNQSVVDVQLVNDATQLSEVVVTALGVEVSKDRLGSSTSSVNGNAIKRSGEATLINGLAGKAAGVYINRTTGDPGAGSYIQIRGQSSINNSVQPLIVVDGVPVWNTSGTNTTGSGNTGGVAQQSRLNDINPGDIETMEVLKGASASALWGSRAANGVIMITTKKGASGKGKVNISYGASYSQDKILVKHPMQRSYGQGVSGYYYSNALNNGLFGTTGVAYSFGDKIADRKGGPDDVVSDPADPRYVGYFQTSDGTKIYPVITSDFDPAGNVHGGKNSKDTYDQYDALFQTGHYWDHNLSLSGGDKSGNYYISIGDMNQQGIVKNNSDYHRTSFKVNTEKVFNPVIKLGTNLTYSRIISNRIQQGSNVNGLFLGAVRSAPDFDNSIWKGNYVDRNGLIFLNRQRSYRNHIGLRADPSYDNPVWVMNENLDKSEVDRFIGSTQLDITPIDWLTLTARAGVDHYSDRIKTYYPVNSAGALNTGQLQLQTPRQTQFNADVFARGNWTLSPELTLGAIAGMNFNIRQSDNVGGTTQSFTIVNNPPLNLSNSTATNRTPFNTFSLQRVAAAYATVNVGYKDQLFVNVTGRNEAASTYGRAQSPTYFYPSADVAWQFTKALNLTENKILNFGKLRVGFGQVATQPQPYSTVTYYVQSSYGEPFGSVVNSSSYVTGGYEQSSTLGNPYLKPEVKTEYEFGGDFRLLNDRITVGATYFTNEVKDVLLPVALAPATGFTNQLKNAAALSNKGVELEIAGDVIEWNGFKWNLYSNWSRIRNKVTSLSGTTSLFLAGFTGTSSRAVEGYPVGVLWGVDFKKDENGKLVLDENGFPQEAATESVIGDPNPEWRGGLGSIFSFKGFSLNVLFEHSHGGQIWGGTRGAMVNFGTHADTDMGVTLTAAEAATLKNYGGNTIANYGGPTDFGYAYAPNADGSYTIRGQVTDFGGGPVVVDEMYWTGIGGGFGPVSSQFIESAQWTRLRELTLAYSLNSTAFRKATKLSSIDFSITGRNLMLWSDFKGNDPETNLTGPTNGRGIDYFNNPATKSVVFSVKINY